MSTHLAPHLKTITDCYKQGMSIRSIAQHLLDNGVVCPWATYSIDAMAGMVRYEINRNIDPITNYHKPIGGWEKWRTSWREARHIHVFLLRCEGLSYEECGERLGVTKQQARQLHCKAVRRLARAWRHVLPLVEQSWDTAAWINERSDANPTIRLHDTMWVYHAADNGNDGPN